MQFNATADGNHAANGIIKIDDSGDDSSATWVGVQVLKNSVPIVLMNLRQSGREVKVVSRPTVSSIRQNTFRLNRRLPPVRRMRVRRLWLPIIKKWRRVMIPTC